MGVAKPSLNMKKIIQKNEKICHESWISIGRFCFRSGVAEKPLEKMGLSQHLTTAVISTCVWAGTGGARTKKKAKAKKMLENGAESPPSSAPKKMAGHHFLRENVVTF